ncbi:MAG: hypothetical protein HQK51_10395 [Oligoflexia bacterium]|nr:hypothetical protein [Oligoflexia bacterium]
MLSLNSWSLPKDKAVGTYGVFKKTLPADLSANHNDVTMGIFSLMFPRAGKISLDKGVRYIGGDYPFSMDASATPTPGTLRSVSEISSAGEGNWMDGCNIRVSHLDENSNEAINSCNVTATIDLIAIDPLTGKEYEIDITNKNEIKLQLTRSSSKDYKGNETLYQSMKSCNSSTSCAADECCFNKRCWSKNLVSQCLENSTSSGELTTGAICNSDYQCASLCCNTSIGRCAIHNSKLTPPVFCSKPPGDRCVAKEWCRVDTVQNCMIVRTGVNALGNITCALRCYNRPSFGTCTNGVCVAPVQPPRVNFDANNPDCSQAVAPPVVIDQI